MTINIELFTKFSKQVVYTNETITMHVMFIIYEICYSEFEMFTGDHFKMFISFVKYNGKTWSDVGSTVLDNDVGSTVLDNDVGSTVLDKTVSSAF
ncbi:LOW QUALITY PROTEIN: hypothetical protein MAR_036847 [Mya arenaria]|uniref:Uncharacterized protein n=1 Tax=Mya arenaria TaxID=6604 RepID=A0ABY7FLU1_MYAAR|nr:LOW QUALITY PROTEIN: hypothetical protein MAR_036847 [Mya arenaria]